jgi:hypothetical protein
MRECPPCDGTGKRWVDNADIECEVCKGEGVVSSPSEDEDICRHCLGTGLLRQRSSGYYGSKNELCAKCSGLGVRRPPWAKSNISIVTESVEVFMIEAGKKYTAHITCTDLLGQLNGTLRICDPYFGSGSLSKLHSLGQRDIRFLTLSPDLKESKGGVLQRLLSDFLAEFPGFEVRTSLARDFHDRFILTDEELILIGAGLKDLGNKESFIVRLPRAVAGLMIDDLCMTFDQRWATATPLFAAT